MVAFIHVLDVCYPGWAACGIAEVDNVLTHVEYPVEVMAGVKVHRHVPGSGSWSMAIITRKPGVKPIWSGRAGRCQLAPNGPTYVFAHLSHGDILADDLHELSILTRGHLPLIIAADWNVDMLPTVPWDPIRVGRLGRQDTEIAAPL